MADKQENKLGSFLKTVGRGVQAAAGVVGKFIYDHPVASTFAFLGLASLGTGIGLEAVKEGTELAAGLMAAGASSLAVFSPLAGTFVDPEIREAREIRASYNDQDRDL